MARFLGSGGGGGGGGPVAASTVTLTPPTGMTSTDVQAGIAELHTGWDVLPTAASALGLWRFLGDLTDSSGNSRTLTSAATPRYETGPRGRGAVIFENNASLLCADAALDSVGTVAIEALYRCGSFNGHNIAGALTSGFTQVNYNVTGESGGLVMNQITNTGFYAIPAGRRVPMDGQFHHIVVNRIVSGGNITVQWFIDGVAYATDTRAGVPQSGGGTFYAMVDGGGGGDVTFPSALAGLAVHNAALSLATVQARARAVLAPGYVS